MALNRVSLELAGGIKVLNPDPVDPRFRVPNLTDSTVTGDLTMYIGFGPILNLVDHKLYFVSGNKNTPDNPVWEFKEIGKETAQVQAATQTEVDAGTVANKYVSPKTLKSSALSNKVTNIENNINSHAGKKDNPHGVTLQQATCNS